MYNLVIIILGIGIIQSVIFALLVSHKQPKSLSHKVLFVWFFVFAIHFLSILLVDFSPSKIFLILAKNFILLYGPLLWLYSYTVYTNNLSRKQLYHLLPFLVFTLTNLFIGAQATFWEIPLVISKLTSILIYPSYTIVWTNRQIGKLKASRSDNFIFETRWIKLIAFLMLVNGCIGLLHVSADITLILEFSELIDILTYVIMMTIMGYYGLKLGVVFPARNKDNTTPRKSYKHSPLSSEEKQIITYKIKTFFEENTLYLDHSFSLNVLSTFLELPKHHLSEVINTEMQSTFYDLVNGKRITYAISRMDSMDSDNITFEGLGYESGFSTKSAFYHHFKIHTGKTPGKFKAEMRPD